MDILPLHIEYLLTRNDCVIVPGLGAFIASEQEAYIDLERGVIRPRRREISFNGSVRTDDGLLTHSIARREGLSYEDARRFVAALADRMATDLQDEGEVSLGMTGRLVKDPEGLISFQPRRSEVISDIMQDVKLTRKDVAATAEKPATTVAVESADEEDGMRTIRVKADRYVFTVSKRAVHAAAMLVAILTIGLSLMLPVNHDREQKAAVISFEDIFRREAKSSSAQGTQDANRVNVEMTDSLSSAGTLDTLRQD